MSSVRLWARPRVTIAVLSAMAGVFWVGCTSDQGPPPPVDALAQQLADVGISGAAADQARTLITELRSASARSDKAAAEAKGFALASLMLAEYGAVHLSGTRTALVTFLGDAFVAAGLPRPPITASSLGDDGLVAVVPTGGGTFTTPRKHAGISVPAGALTAEVLLVVDRLPDSARYAPGAGPLPTPARQYPLFYEFSVTPERVLASDAVIGLCQVTDPLSQFYIPDAVLPRIRLAHPSPDNRAVIEFLERVDAPFLECVDIVAGDMSALVAARRPGIGGRVRKFSPFGAVDPATGPLSITTTALPTATVATAYSVQLQATGGDGTYAWSIPTGTLPNGLSLNAVTGVIAGKASAVASASVTVRVTSGSATAERALTLVVQAPNVPLTVSTTTLPEASVGSSYSAPLAATGGTGAYAWSVVAGALPAGLSLNGPGTLSGTPTAAGTSTFTVRVTSGTATAQRELSLVVAPQQNRRGPLNLRLDATSVDTVALLIRVTGPAIDSVQLLLPDAVRSTSTTTAQLAVLGATRDTPIARIWVRDTAVSYSVQVLQAARRAGYALLAPGDVSVSLTR